MVYLDNAAAARPTPETAAFFAASLLEDFCNQEAAHGAAGVLRKKLKEAEEKFSYLLTGSGDWQVVWCPGGTDAFALLAEGIAGRNMPILTSALEHPSLLAALKRLSGDIRYLSPDRKTGRLQVRQETCALAAFHLVQSETGTLQDAESLFAALPGAIHILDAVQAAGKMPLPLAGTDILTVSGNKFGSPGCAALLLSPRWKERKIFLRRCLKARSEKYLAGRMQPAAVFTCVRALEKRLETQQEDLEKVRALNQDVREGLARLGLEATVPAADASPYILHLTVPGHQGGVLVRMLSEEGVMVSSGSACASETDTPSPALTALGFRKKEAFSGLRISFDNSSRPEEVKFLLSSLESVLKKY